MVATAKPTDDRRTSLLIVVVAGSVFTSIMLGVRSTFGLFLEPVVETLQTDRGTFAFAIAVQNLLWGATQPLAGAIADRFGSARVLAVGAVGYMASLFLMATAETSGMLLLSVGFLVGISTGAASFAVILAAVGRLVPPERRSMALGIVTAMGSVGQFVLIPVAQRLLENRSWQQAIVILGVVVIGATLMTPPFRGRAVDQLAKAAAGSGAGGSGSESSADPDRTLRTELRRAANHRPYVLLNMAFFVCGFHVTFIGVHLPAYVSDLGLGASTGATALALIGLFNIFGSLSAGFLGGRYSKSRLLSIIYGSRALVIAIYVLAPATATTTLLFGATFGLLWLSTVPLTSGIVSGQFGTLHSGALFGIVFFSHQLGAFTGVWLGGELFDSTGSYRVVWFIALALGVAASVIHLFIDERPAPEPPIPATSGIGIAPAGAASIVVVAGLTAASLASAAASTSATASPASEAPVGQPSETTAETHPSIFCPLVAS
ncbi:MAG: MFS transporter [Acidimicrobiales bacterium]